MKRRIEVITYDEITGGAILSERNVVTKAHWVSVKCKYCNLPDYVVQFGKTDKGNQRYYCHNCQRTFQDNKAPDRMHYSSDIIGSAINQFYETASLHKIEPETVVKLKFNTPQNMWFWDIIDDGTKFLLASYISETRSMRDAQILMERAEKRANAIPEFVVTDKLKSYLDAIKRTWGADTKHVQSGPFVKGRNEDSTRAIERFHGTLKDRTKIMRGLGSKESAKIITDGWLVHYNFFRPHSGLKGKTPAEVAGAKSPYRSWKDVVRG